LVLLRAYSLSLAYRNYASGTTVNNTHLVFNQAKYTVTNDIEKTQIAQVARAKAWYWENHSSLLPKYRQRWLGVVEGKVIASGESYAQVYGQTFGKDIPVFLVYCGMEYADSPVIVIGTDHFTVLLQEPDIPTEHRFEGQPVQNFKTETFFHGLNERPSIVLPLRTTESEGPFYPTTFLIDTGAPGSFLTEKSIKKLGLKADRTHEHKNYGEGFKVWIGKRHYHFYVAHRDQHWANVNLLGTNILWQQKLVIDRPNNSIWTSERG